ncbi:MAG: hypothetical protein NVS3B26_01110 [Mycobacteriales bacterium]
MRNPAPSRRDHRGMTGRGHADEDRAAEALLTGHGQAAPAALRAAIRDVHDLGRGAAPAPSIALAQLLEDGFVVSALGAPSPRRRAMRRRGVRGAVLAVVAAGSITAAATAANALPGRAQQVTASILNAVMPFHFPGSRHPDPARPSRGTSPAQPLPAPPVPSASGTTQTADRPDSGHVAPVSPDGDSPQDETGRSAGVSGPRSSTENSTENRNETGTGTGADHESSDDRTATAAPQPAASAGTTSSPARSPEPETTPEVPATTGAAATVSSGEPSGNSADGVG